MSSSNPLPPSKSYATLKASVITFWTEKGKTLCALCLRPCRQPPEAHHLEGGMGRDKHSLESETNLVPVHGQAESACHARAHTKTGRQTIIENLTRRLHDRQRHGDESA